jgi:hypothetical protein
MKAGERCVSIVPPTNAPTCARCGRLLHLLFQPYTILGMVRPETKTHWTASRAVVDPQGAPLSGRLLACQASLSHVYPVAFALRLWLFGLPIPPPVGGREHLRFCYLIYPASGRGVSSTDSRPGAMQDYYRTSIVERCNTCSRFNGSLNCCSPKVLGNPTAVTLVKGAETLPG